MPRVTIWNKIINVWEVGLAGLAILVTIAIFCIVSISNAQEKITVTADKVAVVERKVDSHDALLQKQSDALADIKTETAVNTALLNRILKNQKDN